MSNNLPKCLVVFSFFGFLFSCQSKKVCKECDSCGENMMYKANTDVVFIEDQDTLIAIDTASDLSAQFAENKKKIEAKYGEQWDFCHCIIANDSLDRLVKSNAKIDEAFMNRFDEVDKKCKAFLVMSPNITPEERAKHEQKARKCLKSAKK